jgi:hypothetical protein
MDEGHQGVGEQASAVAESKSEEVPARRRPRPIAGLVERIASLVRAIEENDDTKIEAAILRLSRSRRALAPLGLAVGAFVLLFDAMRLVVSNWRLAVVEILPAMWIWLAMLDLKAHVLHGKSFNVVRGPILIPLCLAIVALTAASFFLNAVFAFAISRPGRPEIRPAVAEARRHLTPILGSGVVVGAMLAFSTMIVSRWHRPWFALCLGLVVGVMMVAYVAVPSRLIGAKPKQSKRDKLVASALAGTLSAAVCTPPYVLGRAGILMLGSKVLFVPGIVCIAVGLTLQAGATGSVRAIKMSASLATRRSRGTTTPPREPRPA